MTLLNNVIWLAIYFFMFELKLIDLKQTFETPAEFKAKYVSFKRFRNIVFSLSILVVTSV
jgi:hypothetical protein